MSILSNLRDKAVEKFIRNHELVLKFGEIKSVSINSEDGFADVIILLHGEENPLRFRAYYFWDTQKNATDLVVRKITCERQWINDALDFWLKTTTLRYTIPGIAGGLAKIIF